MKEESSISFWVVFFLHFLRFLVLFLSGRTLQLGELLDCIFWIFFHLPRVRNIRKVVFGGSSWDKKPNFSNLYQIKVLMTSSPSIMRTFIFNICGKIIMEKYQRKWDERGLTFFGAAGDVFRSWLRTFEDIGEWVRTPQKIHDCPLRVRANTTGAFLSDQRNGEFCTFFWIVAGQRQRHCSESLKIGESATARAVICNIWRTIGPQPHCWGKVSLNVEWVKKERESTACQLRWSFYDRISRFQDCLQEGGKSKLKMRKDHIFLHHIANSILPWPWLEKESLGNGNHFERLKVGRSFASVCRNARHLNQITNNCSKKKKRKKNYLSMQPQGVLDFLIRIRRKLVKDISLTSFLLILLILDMTFPNHPFEKTFAVDSLLLSHLLKHFPFSVHCCTINLWWQS